MAIDLLIHHGGNKTVKIIINPSGPTTNRLEDLFEDHGRIALRAFRDRLEVRVRISTQHLEAITSQMLRGSKTGNRCMWQIQSPRMQLILTLSGIHWQG
jgi:hypothetical protein